MLHQHKQYNNTSLNRGFTLLELLVAMGIFTLLIGSVVVILSDTFKNNTIISKQLERQTDGRKVLEQVVDDVRRAEQSSIGSYSVEYAGNNELRFYANLDSDGYIEKVRYFIDGLEFKKGIIKPSGNPLMYVTSTERIVTLARNVTNLARSIYVFSYYDQNYTGSETAMTQPVTASNVRMIKIFLEMEDNPDKTPIALSVQSMAEIRNLKGN